MAVNLMIGEVLKTGAASRLVAETITLNRASQRVLERNGFAIDGARRDAEDGELMCWSRSLAP